MTHGKIGFCCIVLNKANKTPPLVKFQNATVAHTEKLSKRERERYIRERVDNNVRALYETVNWLRKRPAGVRMFRITSGFFPLFTHSSSDWIYDNSTWMYEVLKGLQHVGNLAREHGVRLSLHPGQHCVLNSASEAVRLRSVQEFEYHTLVATMLGYAGRGVDDFCINVHGGLGYKNSGGVNSWNAAWPLLSRAAQRLITLENDEFSWNTHQIFALTQHLKARMVLDVHHHWIHTGRWPDPTGHGAQRIREQWGERRPKIHLSTCLPYFLDPFVADAPESLRGPDRGLPRFPAQGVRANLRVHSDYIWSPAMVGYTRAWLDAGFDVQVESKAKNRASFALYNEVRKANRDKRPK